MAKSRKKFEGRENSVNLPQSANDSATATAVAERERIASESPATAPDVAPDRERIALRAYELYLSRGGADGRDMDDWLDAERELADVGRSRDD